MIRFEDIQHEEPVAPTASFEAVLVDIPPSALNFSVPPLPPSGEGTPTAYPTWDNLPSLPPIYPPPDGDGEEIARPQPVLVDLAQEIALAARLKEQGWTVNTILQNKVFAHWNAAWHGRNDVSLLEICFTEETNARWSLSLLADFRAVYSHEFEWLPVGEVPSPQWAMFLIEALEDADR